MKREQYYKNKRTGERTESHRQAMEWYRARTRLKSGTSLKRWASGFAGLSGLGKSTLFLCVF